MRDIRQAHRIVQRRGAAKLMARLGDFLIACILLAIALPLMIIVALVIKLESPGPVLHRQTCIGRGGRRFQMLKFRTAMHHPHQSIPPWTQVPTRIGQFLRYTRIEALPQIINVLRDEMNIIDREGGTPSFLD